LFNPVVPVTGYYRDTYLSSNGTTKLKHPFLPTRRKSVFLHNSLLPFSSHHLYLNSSVEGVFNFLVHFINSFSCPRYPAAFLLTLLRLPCVSRSQKVIAKGHSGEKGGIPPAARYKRSPSLFIRSYLSVLAIDVIIAVGDPCGR
jgi:hypothetical protein